MTTRLGRATMALVGVTLVATLAVAATLTAGSPRAAASGAEQAHTPAVSAPPAAASSPTVDPSPSDSASKVREQLIHYGPGERQTLQARWLEHAGTSPAVVLIHGGHWTEGGRWQVRELAQDLNKRGYATFTPHYRLNDTAVWPAQREDLGAALANIRAHAGRYHLDPQRVILAGFSVGGQLALSLALLGDTAQVAGVVAVSAPVDPWQAWLDGQEPTANGSARKLHRNAEKLAGCLPALAAQPALRLGATGDPCADGQWRDTIAATHVSPHDPPVLLIHTEGDFVNPAPVRSLATVVQRAGVPVRTVMLAGSEHGVHVLDKPAAMTALLSFLATYAPVASPG